MPQELVCNAFEKPFPHLIVNNFYNDEELELIWEELKFYTKPGKLLEAKDFGGVIDKTNHHALQLDVIYDGYRDLSNILTVNRKLFTSGILDIFAEIHESCWIAPQSDYDITKVRYYHDKEYYEAHTDKSFQFLAFSCLLYTSPSPRDEQSSRMPSSA